MARVSVCCGFSVVSKVAVPFLAQQSLVVSVTSAIRLKSPLLTSVHFGVIVVPLLDHHDQFAWGSMVSAMSPCPHGGLHCHSGAPVIFALCLEHPKHRLLVAEPEPVPCRVATGLWGPMTHAAAPQQPCLPGCRELSAPSTLWAGLH